MNKPVVKLIYSPKPRRLTEKDLRVGTYVEDALRTKQENIPVASSGPFYVVRDIFGLYTAHVMVYPSEVLVAGTYKVQK